MAARLRRGAGNDRVQEILADPEGYFERARTGARDEISREMATESERRGLLRRPRRPAGPAPA